MSIKSFFNVITSRKTVWKNVVEIVGGMGVDWDKQVTHMDPFSWKKSHPWNFNFFKKSYSSVLDLQN